MGRSGQVALLRVDIGVVPPLRIFRVVQTPDQVVNLDLGRDVLTECFIAAAENGQGQRASALGPVEEVFTSGASFSTVSGLMSALGLARASGARSSS